MTVYTGEPTLLAQGFFALGWELVGPQGADGSTPKGPTPFGPIRKSSHHTPQVDSPYRRHDSVDHGTADSVTSESRSGRGSGRWP